MQKESITVLYRTTRKLHLNEAQLHSMYSLVLDWTVRTYWCTVQYGTVLFVLDTSRGEETSKMD